jgi:hypothetical protein
MFGPVDALFMTGIILTVAGLFTRGAAQEAHHREETVLKAVGYVVLVLGVGALIGSAWAYGLT